MILPNFIIAGERRSGTTTLDRWMRCHPDVFVLPQSDMAFFVDDALVGQKEWLSGEPDYGAWDGAHSPAQYSAYFAEGQGKLAVGEKSADYLFWRPAHERLARYLPDAKFIVTLRNPIERAWSHYWNEVSKGREELTFTEALAAEDDRCASSAYARDHLSYRTRGFYDESLHCFWDRFSPERVHVVILDELIGNPIQTLGFIYCFIGVDPDKGLERAGKRFNSNWASIQGDWAKLPVLRAVEKGAVRLIRAMSQLVCRDGVEARDLAQGIISKFRKTKKDVHMPEEIRQELLEVYLPHIENLEGMLGRSLAQWKA